MRISDRLKKMREFLGKTQKEMAIEIGVSVTAWQNYENGIQCPGGKVLEALARLGFDINWLLIGTGSMKNMSKLTEIGGELVPQPIEEHLDKNLLALTFKSLMPVFDEFDIKNYEQQAGVITDVYSSILEKNMERTPKTVDTLTSDVRSIYGNIKALQKYSNLFNFMKKN